MLRNTFERDSEIRVDCHDWEKSLNEWKETEKRDWEIADSECSVEGGNFGSVWKDIKFYLIKLS